MSIPGFEGQLLRTGDPGYDDRRRVFNGMVDHRPACIARCETPADVAAAIRFGRARELAIGVRGGGHSIVGFSCPDGGLMIDLGPMGDARVDPGRRRAWVRGGALLGALDDATEPHGLATTAGNVSHTGVGGLTLGGGMGWLARRFGLSCDNVEAFTLVTADGEVVRVSATEHPDLFWGLRGGGGNFGVVTEFEFRLHPISHRALRASLVFDAADALGPLQRWRDLLAQAPREATMVGGITTALEEPDLPQRLGGRSVVTLGFTWIGEMADAREWLGVMRGIGSPAAERIAEMSYVERQRMSDAILTAGRRYYTKDLYLTAFTDAALAVFLARGATDGAGDPARLADGGLLQWGGAIGDIADDEAAFSHRDAVVEWDTSARWEDPAEDAWRLAGTRAYAATMEPFASGSYVNTFSDTGDAALRRAYRPDKLARLRELKRAWDPDTVIRLNQNVTPA
jgi:FAD/FMN-containing dehydrogenase